MLSPYITRRHQLRLKRLREAQPRQDRASPALADPPPPVPQPSPRSRYVRVHLFAQTLDDLREKCREHGEAAVAEARWGAITVWLMKEGYEQFPGAAISVAVNLLRDDDRERLGYPHHAGKPIASRLPFLSPDTQAEARRLAAEARAAWERAGSPYLTPKRITDEHQYIQACILAAQAREAGPLINQENAA
jgi:hypothetical protein